MPGTPSGSILGQARGHVLDGGARIHHRGTTTQDPAPPKIMVKCGHGFFADVVFPFV